MPMSEDAASYPPEPPRNPIVLGVVGEFGVSSLFLPENTN